MMEGREGICEGGTEYDFSGLLAFPSEWVLSLNVFVFLPVQLSVCLSVYLSVCLSVCLSACLSVCCLSVCSFINLILSV